MSDGKGDEICCCIGDSIMVFRVAPQFIVVNKISNKTASRLQPTSQIEYKTITISMTGKTSHVLGNIGGYYRHTTGLLVPKLHLGTGSGASRGCVPKYNLGTSDGGGSCCGTSNGDVMWNE